MKKSAVFFFAIAVFLCALTPLQKAGAGAFVDPDSRSGGAGGDLLPVEADVNGGDIKIGSTTQVVVLFRNDSGRPVSTGAIQLYPSSTASGEVSQNQCSQEPLPSGAVCAIAVSVKGLQSGPWRIEMLMRHSGRARLVTATLSGQIQSGEGSDDVFVSDIEALPGELDFGSLDTAQPLIKAIVLRNSTSEAIDINSIYIEAADQSGYSLRTDCSHLGPGQACIVTVKWSPILKGQATGVLLVEHTGPTSVTSVVLDGSYAPAAVEQAEVFPEAVPGKGLLVSSLDEIDFGGEVQNLSNITVSLVNVGDAPLTIKDIRMGGKDTGVNVVKSGCAPDMVLEPIEACPMTVSWSPVREGSILDDIQVVHDGARGILVLPVRGISTGVVSQDTKAVRIGTKTISATTTTTTTGGTKEEQKEVVTIARDESIDPASVLDGFVITSHSPTRSIISGPGGSRIVFDGEEVVLGGLLWYVNIRTSGVEFSNGPDKVLLLFDRSLSSFNRVSGQSVSGSSSTGTDE